VFANLESYAPEVFHVALPIAATAKGDSKPVGQFRSQIEEAATQVMRGLNGFIEMLSTNPQLLNPTGRQDAVARFLPTIFTTASLWVSDADLATADITTGKIDLSQGQFKKVPWLWYQYNVSPGIKHSRQALEKKRKLEEVMQEEHIRTIAVVNPSGLPEFLEHTSDFY